MKKMKFLALALTVAMFGSTLVACSTKKTEDMQKDTKKVEEKKPAEEKPAEKKDGLKVGVFYFTFADPYISTVRTALGEKLKAAGVDFNDFDGNNNPTTQIEQIDTALAQGTKLLIVNFVNTKSTDAAKDVVKKATEAGAQVIFFNREIDDSVVKAATGKVAFVGTDAPEAGHLQGELIGQYVVENFDKLDLNKDGKISYAMYKGEQGNPEADARTKYGVEDADKVLEKANKPKLVYYNPKNTDKYEVDKDGAWSAKAANEYMTTALATFNDANKNMIELVIANNDGMAMGAIEALNTVGYNKGDDKFIPVFGVDATKDAIEAIKANKMVGTIKQDAEGMAATIQALVSNVKEGKELMAGAREKFVVDKNVDKIRVPYAKVDKNALK